MNDTYVSVRELLQGRVDYRDSLISGFVLWTLMDKMENDWLPGLLQCHISGLRQCGPVYTMGAEANLNLADRPEAFVLKLVVRCDADLKPFAVRPKWTRLYVAYQSITRDGDGSAMRISRVYSNRASVCAALLELADYGPVQWNRDVDRLILSRAPMDYTVNKYLWYRRKNASVMDLWCKRL